eukprot:TRINITY_DN15959_c0_g1_i1.p1 TRINITY_DN15959_c0_g1~~TRINITY_DN15959_c0_g1_i1.p1  ORF type:complete len:480 (+),score=50.89 TRINITY_DN15959_c0_g1_i1:67-1506(+)
MLRRREQHNAQHPDSSENEAEPDGSPVHQRPPVPSRRERSWKTYLMMILLGSAGIIAVAKVQSTDGKFGSKADHPGCSLFMTSGPYGIGSQMVSYARHWGCRVFLGDPWSDASSLRNVVHELIDSSPELRNKKEFMSVRKPDVLKMDCPVKEFIDEYAGKGVPVLFKDANITNSERKWGTNFWREKCGDRPVTPSRYNREKKNNWAGMEPHPNGTVPLSTYVENLANSDAYLHDWALPVHCPEVLEGITIPKYFTNDYLQLASHGSKYRNEWPSLFIGPKSSETGVHVDNLGSHAWLHQLQGRKKWRIVRSEQASLMYSTPFSYNISLFDTDFEEHKMARLLNVYEVITEPGDVIFVPAGALHQVINLEDSIAITSNYIDHSCLVEGLKALDEASAVDEAVYYLSKELKAKAVDGSLPVYPSEEGFTWEKFKSQRFERPAETLNILDHPDSEKYIVIILATVLLTVAVAAYVLYMDLGV